MKNLSFQDVTMRNVTQVSKVAAELNKNFQEQTEKGLEQWAASYLPSPIVLLLKQPGFIGGGSSFRANLVNFLMRDFGFQLQRGELGVRMTWRLDNERDGELLMLEVKIKYENSKVVVSRTKVPPVEAAIIAPNDGRLLDWVRVWVAKGNAEAAQLLRDLESASASSPVPSGEPETGS